MKNKGLCKRKYRIMKNKGLCNINDYEKENIGL